MSDLIKRAKAKAALLNSKRRNAKYVRAIEWLSYIGLIRHTDITPRESRIRLDDLLFAAQIEPRVQELLPVILVELSETLPFSARALPVSLREVVEAIKEGDTLPTYENIPPSRYMQWFKTPAITLAKTRLNPRSKPRMRDAHVGSLGEIIQKKRVEMGFTQKHYSKTFNVSLRALRDLEQGKIHVTIERANAILRPLQMTLEPQMTLESKRASEEGKR